MSPSADARIHPAAATFDASAPSYERGRPEYPGAALEALARHLELGPGSTVLELAAGTGKLTRSLAPLHLRIVAVEPLEGMRAQFRSAVPTVPILDGTAERIPLGDGAVDAVLVGQAFHWFGPEAMPEMARVLRPGGGLGLVYNVRDERVPWVAELSRIVHRFDREAPPTVADKVWKERFRGSTPFAPLSQEMFPHAQRLTPELLIDRVLSVSYVGGLPEPRRQDVLAGVRQLLDTDPALAGRGTFDLPYVTEIYWTRRRE